MSYSTEQGIAYAIAGLVALFMVISIVGLTVEVRRLNSQVTNLNHACVPVYTGGGVTQCSQPNVLQAPPTK